MSYSPNLVYFLDRLSGFSTNIFKLMPNGSAEASPNTITRITLPANALLNTRSFKLHFTANCTVAHARLPADISTLIERVEVSAGGVQLSQGMNFYNTLCNAKAALMGQKCDTLTGHPEMVRENMFDGGAVGASNIETYGDAVAVHCIDKWEGFLGTCEPKILDAAILPDLVVSIYWADSKVNAQVTGKDTHGAFVGNGSGGTGYEIKNIHASIETIGLADSVYDNMVSSMIAQKGFVEVPFKQYFSFSSTHSGSSRFTVATQSLDRIWTAWRQTGYDTPGGAHSVPGYSTITGDDTETLAVNTLMPYDGMFGTVGNKFITNYQRFSEPDGDGGKLTYQLQLNGAYYPQYPARMEDMYQITKNSLPGPIKPMTKEQYADSFFVQCVRLNMPDSEFSRTISGLDTRSVSLNGYVNTTGALTKQDDKNAAQEPNLMIFAECTSSLRIGSGRQLEIII